MKKLVALALCLVVCFAWFVAPLAADGDPTWPQPIKSATLPGDDSKTDAPTIIGGLGLDPFIELALVTLI